MLGAQAFHIPQVEVFMCYETQEVIVPDWAGISGTGSRKDCRIQVLQTTVRTLVVVRNEHIPVVRVGTPKRGFHLYDFGNILAQLFLVIVCRSDHGKFMRNTGSNERPGVLVTDLQWRIVEDIKILCEKDMVLARYGRKTCRYFLPLRWQDNFHGAFMVEVPIYIEESSCGTDESMLIIHQIGADRSFKTVHPVGYQGIPGCRFHAPSILLGLEDAQRIPIGIMSSNLFNILGEFTDQIGAWCPSGHL